MRPTAGTVPIMLLETNEDCTQVAIITREQQSLAVKKEKEKTDID